MAIESGLVFGCFTGDTKIKIVDKQSLSLFDLHRMYGCHNPDICKYKSSKCSTRCAKIFYVYTLDSFGKVIVGRAHSPRITQENVNLLEIKIKGLGSYRCSPNHRHKLSDNTFILAKHLKDGDELLSLRYDQNGLMVNGSTSFLVVESVKVLSDTATVYDFTVEKHANFALDIGNFVSNSTKGVDYE